MLSFIEKGFFPLLRQEIAAERVASNGINKNGTEVISVELFNREKAAAQVDAHRAFFGRLPTGRLDIKPYAENGTSDFSLTPTGRTEAARAQWQARRGR